MENIKNLKYKLVYVSPERLLNKDFLDIIKSIKTSLVAIDEAHCISHWGHDFRKSYSKISNFITILSTRPTICAFTASATELVKKDIINILKLENPYIKTTTFDRRNLFFSVKHSLNKNEYCLNFLKNNLNDCGIIYCISRKNVEFLYDYLLSNGFNVSKYHAGLNRFAKLKFQNNFLLNKSKIMIATNAFGMGIDKPDIRYVLHYNMPKDIEAYYQEAGRAGRDNQYSKCTLLYDKKDILINKYLIDNSHKNMSKKLHYKRLNDMVNYCETKKCLRSFLLNYFGETTDFHNCQNCTNCIKNRGKNYF